MGDTKAKIVFDIEVLKDNPYIKPGLFDALDQLEAGDKEAICVHRVAVHGDKAHRVDGNRVVAHYLYIYEEDVPPWLQGKEYNVISMT